MPNNYYKHGVYGSLGESISTAAETSTTVVYIGTAPVHLTKDYTDKVNVPLRINSMGTAKKIAGYSDDWKNYTLCEPMDAHFNNSVMPVGPIYIINVLDPEKISAEGDIKRITFSNGKAVIPGNLTIVSSVKIADKVIDRDYLVDYSEKINGVVITDLTGTVSGEVDIEYKKIEPEKVTITEIIGKTDENGKTGINALSRLYAELGVVPSVVACPKWSSEKSVHDAMISAAKKVNGKFYAFALTDIPLEYKENGQTQTVKNIETAINAKKCLSFNSESEKVFWPMAEKIADGNSKKYHISVLTAVAIQQTDLKNGGLPFGSPSNSKVDITGVYINESEQSPIYDEENVNRLNAEGITSIVLRGGSWRLWGPHTAAYSYYEECDPRAIFDSSMRMLYFAVNEFVSMFGDKIDTALSRNQIDSILDAFKTKLDLWVAAGALLHADIRFDPDSNSAQDMLLGDFNLSMAVTTTPMIKSITAVVSYTNSGLLELTKTLKEGA